MATPANTWSAPSPQLAAAQPVYGEEPGLQARPMNLKVHYSFDQNNQVHCLARWPHILQIPTIPLDERTTIGVVDLRTCLQAVAQSSPEILSQQDHDYSVYAHDVSEPDVPLVGQGMLSRAMDPQREPQQQLVTGRVTRNLLALLNSGSRDTLEVRLKLAAITRTVARAESISAEPMNGTRSASIPADTTSEWNSFLQSNPMLGHASNVCAVSSPALAPAQLGQFSNPMSENRAMDVQSDSHLPQPMRPGSRHSVTGVPPPIMAQPPSRAGSVAPIPPRPQGPADNAPSPAAPQAAQAAPKTSRPASRSRSKQPTGRPRGRPRKRPIETGNTSAAEEATDGDEGPNKRRAKVTKTEYSVIAPFGAAPDSLRVAASTAGSLRAMRPVGAGGDPATANHLQEVPRAPTPIPNGQLLQHQPRRKVFDNLARSESMLSMDQSEPARGAVQNPSQDARSPADSVAQTPDHGYSPEGSAGDLGSSPPVPQATAYLRSSPPASSPVLPAMPMSQIDSGFMSGGLEDFFDDEEMLHNLAQTQGQQQMFPVSSLPVAGKPNSQRNSRSSQPPPQQSNFPFQEVNPGPPELLPTKSIFNPAGKAKALNRQASAASTPLLPKKPASRPLKRSNTAPNPAMPEQESLPQEPATQQPNADGYEPNGDGYPSLPFQEQESFSHEGSMMQLLGQAAETGYTELSQPDYAPTPALSMPIPERPEPEPVLPTLTLPVSRPDSRPASQGLPAPTSSLPAAQAGDAVAEPALTLPQVFPSEAPCPTSDLDIPRYSKNLVKKQSIKERLMSAIEKGERPPFCNNCGAIETPTWRKIWTQEFDGVPGFHEFSDKPGCVTMIEVLERDAEEQPTKYRMVKKNLGPKDDKKQWVETILCNPCGIWLGKFKVHRPSDRWDKDAARLNQPRKKKNNNSRSKKARSKSDAQINPTSEAYFTTDPIGPPEHDSSKENYAAEAQPELQNMMTADEKPLNLRSSPGQRFLGSTHSRGSGTADSPIRVEDDLGSTRRLLFPSPRRDGVPKVLGELSLNTVQSATRHHPHEAAKSAGAATGGKENGGARGERAGTPTPGNEGDDLLLEQELFGTPPRRPSTPPPKSATAAAGPFKTPTRPTPSHRPITRSISRSIRSIRYLPSSPGQLFTFNPAERTPSRTPRSVSAATAGGLLTTGAGSSAVKRRSPRRNNNNAATTTDHLHAHFALDAHHHSHQHEDDDPLQMHSMHGIMPFDSPFTATLQQLLSEANEFITGSPSRGSGGCSGIGSGSGSDAEREQQQAALDFGSFLSTDLVMPSSPPLMRGVGGGGVGVGVGVGVTGAQEGVGGMWAVQQQQQQQQVSGEKVR